MFKQALIICVLFSGFAFAQPDSALVEVISVNPHIRLDLRYATKNNFLHQKVYPEARCYLRYEAARALDNVQKELERLGLGLKIFDGYRPLSVQKKMWKIMPDARYVANPKKGSRHNRGMAVDLTLVDASGKELSMPTEFDSFSPKAHQDYWNLPVTVLRNRWILRTVMEKHGFKPIRTEWWHYDFKGWKKYKVLDMSFKELEQKKQGTR